MTEKNNKLLEALSQFQGDNITAKRTASNSYFKSAYADIDEVQDYLQDLAVFTGSTKAPAYKSEREYAYGKEIVRDYDGTAVIGWYDDNDGNDIRCRD